MGNRRCTVPVPWAPTFRESLDDDRTERRNRSRPAVGAGRPFQRWVSGDRRSTAGQRATGPRSLTAVIVDNAHVTGGTVDLIYRAGAVGAACWARNHQGHVRGLPMARWFGRSDTTPHDRLADEYILNQCAVRPTLDLGCGPGRFVVALQQRGHFVLGVDNCAAAVELTRERGGTAVWRDAFSPLPAEGFWGQVLLTDGNIGIGGDPVRTLIRAAQLLAAGGVVVVEIDPPNSATSREMLRWETLDHIGPWFLWSRVFAGDLGGVAAAAGFSVTDVVDIHGRVIASLRRC